MKRRSTTGAAGVWLALAGMMLGMMLGMTLAAVPALAHHSFGAEYDGDKPITLTGVVTKIDWTNPHSYFHIDVTDNGAVTNWKFEGYPPSVLSRIGWKRDATMKVGDTVTIYGWRARDNSNSAHSRTVTFKDGKKLEAGPPAGNGDSAATAPPANP